MVRKAGKDRRDHQVRRDNQVMMVDQDKWESVEPQATQVVMASKVLKAQQETMVRKAGKDRRDHLENKEKRETVAAQARQVGMVKWVPQVSQVNQVNQVSQVLQVFQARITTHQSPTSLLNLRPRVHPTPLKAVGAAMERAGTGQPAVAANAPTKRTTNQWTLWKSNVNSLVIQQDLSVLSTTNIFIMYTHMYNVH